MISISIDDKAVRRALAVAPREIARALSEEVRIWTVNGASDFNKDWLRARDDRSASDFLNRRPPKSPGLRTATGGIASDYYHEAPVVTEIGKLFARTGWRSGMKARIARVHELGTVRYGGKLPDIVPRRAPYLAVPVRGVAAARGTKAAIARLKKVGIPPRLGFVKWWTSGPKLAELKRRVKQGAERAIRRAVKAGA